ncbi:MAG TPA: serine hydrolase [Flavitalea sp.]|nr:serine hydrolase [Flavitalea sp.]
MRKTILVFLFAVGLCNAYGQKKLKNGIDAIVKGFHGQVGVYVKNLRTGNGYGFQADSLFPTASMVKLPIMIGVMDKINQGVLIDTQHLQYKDSLLYQGVDILGSFKPGEQIELSKVMMLMLSMSDNTASLWLQSLAGTGVRINQILDSLGFVYTRVNSRTPGREAAREQYGWGQTTPKEMARLLEMLYRHQLVSDSLSERMLKLTSRNYWDQEANSVIPAGVFVSSKNGAVDESRSEVMLVYAGKNPYVLCVCTKNNQDTSWLPTNEAWEITRKISKFVWNYYSRH